MTDDQIEYQRLVKLYHTACRKHGLAFDETDLLWFCSDWEGEPPACDEVRIQQLVESNRHIFR